MRRGEEEGLVRKSGFVYAAVLSIVVSVLTFLGLGWLLDRWLATSPWMVVGGIVLGAVIGFYQFIRLISRISDS